MKITSSAFEHNTPIPSKYTCDGENINPPLSFSDIPDGTESMVLIVEDPDAPSRIWVHWVIYNMSPKVLFIPENGKPSNAKLGMNDFGQKEYGGPCPPAGTHRYFFRLYALSGKLKDMPDFTDKAMLEEVMKEYVLAQAEMIGLYTKQA